MIPLASPPPNLTRSGPAREALIAVADAITSERRAAVDVSTSSLDLLPVDARPLALRVGGTPYALEEGGLRSLFMYYTAAFPRLTPAALLMRPGTLARVFADGIEDRTELPDTARVRVRVGPAGPAVYAVTPTLAPPYDVDAILRDLADAVPPGADTSVTYKADDSRAEVRLTNIHRAACRMPDAAYLRVTIEDGYPCRVSVSRGVGAKDLGDPAPDLERRRRSRGDLARPADGLYVETFRAKLAAVPAWVRVKTGKP